MVTVSQKWDKRVGQWHDHVSPAAFGKVLDRILVLSQRQTVRCLRAVPRPPVIADMMSAAAGADAAVPSCARKWPRSLPRLARRGRQRTSTAQVRAGSGNFTWTRQAREAGIQS
jgi:hypothetical protein